MTQAPNNAAPIVPHNTQQNIPAELHDIMARDSGRGVSTKAEDQLIPMLRVLQTNSPATNKRGSEYVPDAEPGDFFLRGALQPIRSGVEGLDVINCGMRRTWNEFGPTRGTGFFGAHDRPPADVEIRKVIEEGVEKPVLVRTSNNNVVVDTRQIFLLVDGQPYMLPLTGTGHTVAREWTSWLNQLKHPNGGLLPSYAHKYKLTTKPVSKASFRWFGLRFQDIGTVTVPEYHAARALAEIVERGAMRIETPIADN
jgi:hypothetical protein